MLAHRVGKLRRHGIERCKDFPAVGRIDGAVPLVRNEQIAQQQTQNEEMERILSGNADEVTEWVARDSYNYAAPNERIFVDVTGN